MGLAWGKLAELLPKRNKASTVEAQDAKAKQNDTATCSVVKSAVVGCADNAHVDLLEALMNAKDNKERAAIAVSLRDAVTKEAGQVNVKNFVRCAKRAMKKLKSAEGDDKAAALEDLAACVGCILRAQPVSKWTSTSNRSLLTIIATAAHNDSPSVRKESDAVLLEVVKHVAALVTDLKPPGGTFDETAIQALRAVDDVHSASADFLLLLQGLLHPMPEAIFIEFVQLALALVRRAAFQGVHRVLKRQPTDEPYSSDTLIQLIHDLQQMPTEPDIDVCVYWMMALAEAHAHLATSDPSISSSSLEGTLRIFVRLFRHEDQRRGLAAHMALGRIVGSCTHHNPTAAIKCLEALAGSLGVPESLAKLLSLKLLDHLFDTAGDAVLGAAFQQSMRTLSVMRTLKGMSVRNDCACAHSTDHACVCTAEIDRVFKSAIRNVGAEHVLAVVDLDIHPRTDVLPAEVRRAWLLPVLRRSIRNAPLSLFVDRFLPTATALHSRISSMDEPQATLYASIERQLWELLPSFLDSPTDFVEAAPVVLPVLASALRTRPDLHLIVLESLQKALEFATNSGSPAHAAAMRRFAHLFLPTLFQNYTSSKAAVPSDEKATDDSSKDAVCDIADVKHHTIEAIRTYASVAPSALLSKLVKKALVTTANVQCRVEKKALIIDTLTALVPSVPLKDLYDMLAFVRDLFLLKNTGLRKVGYRLLRAICERGYEVEVLRFLEMRTKFFTKLIAAGQKQVCGVRHKKGTAVDLGELMPIYRFLVRWEPDYGITREFCDLIFDQVIDGLGATTGRDLRLESLKCFHTVCGRLFELGKKEGLSGSEAVEVILKAVERTRNTKLKNGSKRRKFRRDLSTLMAMNLVAERCSGLLNAHQLTRVFFCAQEAREDKRRPIRKQGTELIETVRRALHPYRREQESDDLPAEDAIHHDENPTAKCASATGVACSAAHASINANIDANDPIYSLLGRAVYVTDDQNCRFGGILVNANKHSREVTLMDVRFYGTEGRDAEERAHLKRRRQHQALVPVDDSNVRRQFPVGDTFVRTQSRLLGRGALLRIDSVNLASLRLANERFATNLSPSHDRWDRYKCMLCRLRKRYDLHSYQMYIKTERNDACQKLSEIDPASDAYQMQSEAVAAWQFIVAETDRLAAALRTRINPHNEATLQRERTKASPSRCAPGAVNAPHQNYLSRNFNIGAGDFPHMQALRCSQVNAIVKPEFKLQNWTNDHNSCALCATIKSLGTIQWFREVALRRRMNARGNPSFNTPKSIATRELCTELYNAYDPDYPDEDEGHSVYSFRQNLASVSNESGTQLKSLGGVQAFRCIDAILNLLHYDEVQRFKVKCLKAVECPRCHYVSRMSNTHFDVETHFEYSLQSGEYHDPYYMNAARDWSKFGNTYKLGGPFVCKNSDCRRTHDNVHLRERPEETVTLKTDPPKDNIEPKPRFLFVVYVPGGKNGQHLSVVPQLYDSFHAFPSNKGDEPTFDTSHEMDYRLLGYGLLNHKKDHLVYRYHQVAKKTYLQFDNGQKNYRLTEDMYFRPGKIDFALYSLVKPSSQARRNDDRGFKAEDFPPPLKPKAMTKRK